LLLLTRWRAVCMVIPLTCVACGTTSNGDSPYGIDGSVPTSATAAGKTCHANSECEGSPAATDLSRVRCIGEVYCADGQCHGDCRTRCEQVRSDVNACSDGAICVPFDSAAAFCSHLPVQCQSAEQCPAYRPVDAGGQQDQWKCEAGLCTYPGFSFSTK
jgi:hypothetical protein